MTYGRHGKLKRHPARPSISTEVAVPVKTLPTTLQYTNRNGVSFSIEVARSAHIMRPKADHWRYLFKVKVTAGPGQNKHKLFKALLAKEYFPQEEGAALYVMGEPLDYLRHAYLDHYSNGKTPVHWLPDESHEWRVF